jgi:hypothetical protein
VPDSDARKKMDTNAFFKLESVKDDEKKGDE